MRIAIAGAGTAGLAAAAFLARDGHEVRLFERFAEPKPIGAGLLLQPTGLACLAALGLDHSIIAQGQPIAGIRGETVKGVRIFDVRYDALGPHVFGLGIHRGALFTTLYEEVLRLGISVTAATEIASTGLVAGGRVLVDRHGQTHGPFDLVVDCTGVNSPLRGAEATIRVNRPYAYAAVWGIVEEPADWPHRDWLVQRYDGCHIMAGLLPVGSAPGREGRLTALFWSLRARDYPEWRAAGLDPWKTRILSVWPEALPFVAQVTAPDDMTFATYADIALKDYRGERIVFIGDAGRATSPQLGQGANLALIDATTLAGCLRAEPNLAAALAAYADCRRSHTRFYSLASRWLTPFFQSDSRIAAAVRDLAFPRLACVPYLRREMVRTLSGMKTGLFSHLDPGQWHPGYVLEKQHCIAAPPAAPSNGAGAAVQLAQGRRQDKEPRT